MRRLAPAPSRRRFASQTGARIPIQSTEDRMRYQVTSSRRRFLTHLAATSAAVWMPGIAFAADPLKIGLILPLTGPFASTGRQIEAACRLYIERNGDTIAGRKVELIVKDDTGLAPETTKRIAQELVVQERVNVLAGFGQI